MTFQVESVVESFATIVANELFEVVVALDVSIEELLQIERLLTDAPFKTIFNSSLLQYSFSKTISTSWTCAVLKKFGKML